MNKLKASEKVFIEEVAQASRGIRRAIKGLSLGEHIRLIRTQLGMSQTQLAQRAQVPQSTISRLEKGQGRANLATVNTVLKAMLCELLVIPLPQDSIDNLRRQQARKVAEQHVQYLQGTMNLEEQQPDDRFIKELVIEEEKKLLQGPAHQLWE